MEGTTAQKISIRLKYGEKSETYMVSPHSSLGKCFRTYMRRNANIVSKPLSFVFEGRTLHDRDTCDKWQIRDQDVITVVSRGLSG